ncbi:clan AA aspartic protease [Ignicoccus pacificus DSM 13166]|uniref:Clan AA aspartic protease n=1 Tax=Ignicoccus pacificus DSM 13166 TaxID=940294 RepID=A0A977K957_9CREN|nr:clan AA aspartic protease [Ignicoccus pacificus DSM 13166]
MKLAFKEVEISGRKYKALIDTGFNGEVLVSPKVAKEIGLKPLEEKYRTTIDGRKVKVRVGVAKVKIDDEESCMFVEEVEGLPLDVLIGVQALERLGYYVDPKDGTIKKVGLVAV